MLSAADAPPPSAPSLDLRPPRHRVSPRAIRYWTARAAAGWTLVLLAQAGWLGLPGSAAWGAGLAVPVLLALLVQHRARQRG